MANNDLLNENYQLASLNEIKERIKKADMLFQISCYDLSWNESKKIIKELLSYPLPSYPYEKMILSGWEGLTMEKLKIESIQDENQKLLMKKIIKISELDSGFAVDNKKINSESNLFILSFLKTLFKNTLALIKELGKVPKSVNIKNNKATLAKTTQNQESNTFSEESEMNIENEGEKDLQKEERILEISNQRSIDQNLKFGAEIFSYDDIRGPISLFKWGIELEKSIEDSVKNLMDKKSGIITMMMNNWVLVNEIQEYSSDSSKKEGKMYHLLCYWQNNDYPALYEQSTEVENIISLFFKDLLSLSYGMLENYSKNNLDSKLPTLIAKIIDSINYTNRSLNQPIDSDHSIKIKDKTQNTEKSEKKQAESPKKHATTSNELKIQREIIELNKIIKHDVYPNEEKIFLRVLDVVSAIRKNTLKK